MPLLSGYSDRVLTRVLGHDSSNLVGKMAVREILSADRNYFVNTSTGSDSNTGLSSGAAFLTIQHAIDVAAALDPSIYNVIINVTGNSTEEVTLKGYILTAASYQLNGDTTTPSNCTITNTNGVQQYAAAPWNVQGFKIVGSASAVFVSGPGVDLTFNGKMEFGGSNYSIFAANGAFVSITAAYTISGAITGAHLFTTSGAVIACNNQTVTITGTPAISTFAIVTDASVIQVQGNTYTGSATGQRYNALSNGVIDANGGGATYLPGNVAGATSSGGQYV